MDYNVSFVDTKASDINGRYYFVVIEYDSGYDQLWIIYDTIDKKFYNYSLLLSKEDSIGASDSFIYNETNEIQRKVFVYKNNGKLREHYIVTKFLNFVKDNPEENEKLINNIEKEIVEGIL